jgi:hypothetical protein
VPRGLGSGTVETSGDETWFRCAKAAPVARDASKARAADHMKCSCGCPTRVRVCQAAWGRPAGRAAAATALRVCQPVAASHKSMARHFGSRMGASTGLLASQGTEWACMALCMQGGGVRALGAAKCAAPRLANSADHSASRGPPPSTFGTLSTTQRTRRRHLANSSPRSGWWLALSPARGPPC